jgi:hypothetical protein
MRNNHATIGSWFFAIMLLGLATEVTFAEDTEAGGRQGNVTSNAPSNVSAAPGGSQVPPSGDVASETAAKNTEDIDTRITVQSRHAGSKPAKAGEVTVKFSLSGVKNLHRRVFSASGASNRMVRNAVSVPVNQHDLLDRHAGEHSLTTVPAQHIPAGAVGVVGNTAVGIGKPDSGLVHQIIVPPSASPTILNRGISGTTARHRGVGSTGIGGPGRTATGLDGTTFRPVR